MPITLVCLGCGKVLTKLLENFLQSIVEGLTNIEALEKLETKWESEQNHVHTALRICCSRCLIALHDIASYLQTIERIQKLTP